MKQHALLIALLIYSIFSLATFLFWYSHEINTITGDEPHYLVISSGIVNHGSLEQTAPYKEEFKTRKIYKHGLSSEDAQPAPGNTHAVLGPNGLFSVHNIGLPILLALPFIFGGIVGAKLFMIFFGALVVVAAWKFSSHFSDNKTHRLWAIIAATVSLPLIPASNQIYPDVLAGLIALTGLYWFFTVHEWRTATHEVLLAVTIVFLPWLQIKFAATCVILVLSISAKIYVDSKDIQRVLRLLVIAGASCIALAAYNHYAFGKISGPYQSGALEISKTSMMVLFGLHFDQNQGFILQNPVNLIGILSIGLMYKLNRTFALVWALVFLSLIVPNALHPNWYGGGSFSGRFQWAAALVFIIPTIYGLLLIASSRNKMFPATIVGGVLLQLYFFYQYAVAGVNLYNRGAGTWFENYSIFYFPIHSWLPMLFDSSWAYRYGPNYTWMILICTFLIIGFLNKAKFSNKAPYIAGASIAIVISTGFFSNYQSHDKAVFKANQLPSQTGKIENSNRLAEQHTDHPGFINYGPYVPLRKGQYEIIFTYKSSAENSEAIGWTDVFNATLDKQLTIRPIHGTSNIIREFIVEFETTERISNFFEFRTYWNGTSNIELHNIVLRKLVK